MLKITRTLLFIILFIYGLGCSDDSTGPGGNEVEVNSGLGTISVTGAIEAEHEGVSYYIPLKSQSGDFNNLTIRISDTDPTEGNENPLFGLRIIMVGQEGPFELNEGQFELGDSGTVAMVATYDNNIGPDGSVIYSTSTETDGTLTILSNSSNQIEGTYSFQLEAGNNTDSGFVTVSGEFNAECIGGLSC